MRNLILLTATALAAASLACEASPKYDVTPKHEPDSVDPSEPQETAIVAGGCFWGMEKVMRKAPGVLAIEVGYAGGAKTDVKYEDVETGKTGHAESVRIVFDPTKISYEDLLLHYYFRGHDPTMLDQQNHDWGTQYRSEIFTTSKAQADTAARVIAKVDKAGKWGKPVVTKVEPASTFVRAEDYHQDYLIKHPNGYNDHYMRDFDF